MNYDTSIVKAEDPTPPKKPFVPFMKSYNDGEADD